ncbi:uncharacterized protein LOC129595842 [Paramacrobiotus metropolitanus]|uniref:uncharacterized protein LOC129595842 n=1 Tax=Paramacrobiotus metropolitanus TaxID=2943436 RepID=UPI0024456D6E|nr:uncharacterized protein LOC129595842 [Paramacrobiotus metropolitanus]XP_055348948.1 uncharacterized protein LOC129595842 [Paramacrobiotus metropolitanus]
MKMLWAIILVLIAQLLVAASADVNCTTWQKSCRNLSMLYRGVTDLVHAPGWPVSTGYLNQYREKYQTNCRYAKEAGLCFRNMTAECRTWGDQQGSTPFAVEAMQGETWLAMGRLCDLLPEPLRLLAAHQHCDSRDAGHLIRFKLPHEQENLNNQTVEALATETCRQIEEKAVKIKGVLREELVRKCGLEATDVMTEGIDKLYTAYDCPR